MEKLKVLELFGGTGTQTQALKNIGIEHTSTLCEIDKYASDVYNQLHGETKNLGDITKVDINSLKEGDYDLITYSFPCQSVSICGKQEGLIKGSGTTSSLLWECEKIIKKVKPKYLLMENVKNLLSDKFKPQFELWLKILRDMGYKNYYDVLNAKDYGIPQNRERVFCVSILGEGNYFEFPQKQELKLRLKDMLEDKPDEKYYLSNDKINKISMWKSQQQPLERVLGENSISPTLTARGAGEEHSGMILYSGELKETTNIQKECLETKKEPKIDRIGGLYGQATRWGVYNKEGICPTIVASMGEGGGHVPMIEETKEPQINKVEIAQKVRIRKNEIDIDSLKSLLKDSKQNVNKTTKEIAEELNRPITEVEHWFRNDDSFSIPSEEIWFDLKDTLNIQTDEFDKAITEFIEKDNTYDIRNRAYKDNGISPTLTTANIPNVVESKDIERLTKQAYETLEENNCKDGDIINPFNKKVTTDGICPTITTRPEGFKTANLVVVDDRQGTLFDMEECVQKAKTNVKIDKSCYNKVAQNFEREKDAIANSDKDIYYPECESGFQDNRVGLKISPAVRAANDSLFALDNHFRIRKLTPRECWRLMGWKDEQFDKAAYKKEIYYLEGDKKQCNVNLKIVAEKQRHIDMETYVLCTIKDMQDMEILKTIKKLLINKPKKDEMQNVNIVIEKLEKQVHLACATNIIKCFTFMGIHYTLMEEKDQHRMVIIAQAEKGKENIEKYMKITTELNLSLLKLYTILILIEQIIKLKIFGHTTQEVNICGYMQIIENCESNMILKILNLKMETINQNVSSSQLYKQAGNAIVINVLEAIFRQMFLVKYDKKDISISGEQLDLF